MKYSQTCLKPNSRSEFDYKTALKISQEAIGKTVGGYKLIDSSGKPISLLELRGKPLVISFIYTTCYHTCPMTTQNLARIVRIAREALGEDSFAVATVGFDTQFDNPKSMRYFAKQQRVDIDAWYFLSVDGKIINSLITDLGFTSFPSPRGYDHIVQATIIDAEGKVYQQVYGEVFDTPLLVEPLKQLILGQAKPQQPFLDDLISKVRFFCTVYDPSTDAYRFDYSIFIGMFISGSIILLIIFFLVREFLRKP